MANGILVSINKELFEKLHSLQADINMEAKDEDMFHTMPDGQKLKMIKKFKVDVKKVEKEHLELMAIIDHMQKEWESFLDQFRSVRPKADAETLKNLENLIESVRNYYLNKNTMNLGTTVGLMKKWIGNLKDANEAKAQQFVEYLIRDVNELEKGFEALYQLAWKSRMSWNHIPGQGTDRFGQLLFLVVNKFFANHKI